MKSSKPAPQTQSAGAQPRIRAAQLVRTYDEETGSVTGERNALCPDGLCRILNREGYTDLCRLHLDYFPFYSVVGNAYGIYIVAAEARP